MNLSKWFRGIRGKLSAIILGATVCIMALNIVTYTASHSVTRSIDSITKIRMPSIRGLEAMNEGQTAVMQTLGLIERSEGKKEELEKLYKRYEEKRNQIKTGFKLYEPLPQSVDEEQEYKGTFLRVWKDWEDASDAYVNAEKAGRHEEAAKYYLVFNNAFTPSETSLGKIIGINYKNAEVDRVNAEDASSNMIQMTISLGLIGTMFVIIFSVILASKMTKALSQIASQLDHSSDEIASASSQVASAAVQLSQSATEQSASLEETSASLEEINSMIAKSSENAQETSSNSIRSQQKAEDGRTVVGKMLNSMEQISESNNAIMSQVNESNFQMTEIVHVIQEIKNKTKVINEIVFQTKLLSFNASVEAARAGDQGKGFAVVAEEVGNLAQMSGNAAKEISEMLDKSVFKVESIVKDTKEKVEKLVELGKIKIDEGMNVSKQCSEILDEIVQNVSQVASLSKEISGASKEQALGVDEVNRAMGQLDAVNQQNTAASQEAASAAEELSAQTQSLKGIVNELIFTVEGNVRNHAA